MARKAFNQLYGGRTIDFCERDEYSYVVYFFHVSSLQ